MSIIQKLKTLKQKDHLLDEIPLEEHDLVNLFGEHYEDKKMEFNVLLSAFVFEENNKLYFLPFRNNRSLDKKEGDEHVIVSSISSNLIPILMNNQFISLLKYNKMYLKKEGANKKAEGKIKTINEILSHPSVRLKELFKTSGSRD